MKYYEPEMAIIEFETVCTITENSLLYKDEGDLDIGGNTGGSMGDYMN